MIKINKYLVPNGYAAMTVYPFIFVKSEDKITPTLINHEKIHLKQQLELLIILFYIWYFLEFLINYIKFKDINTAYMAISFEKEAYKHENDANYLKNRKNYAFLRK